MQSSNDNNNFLFYGVTEGSNSGIASTTGPFSATTTSSSHSSDHLSRSNNPPSSPHLPLTPTPVNINPRDGIINYLIYQGLLTPDLSLTISPADLNTILSSEKPTSTNSELSSVPIDTTFNSSDLNPTRFAQLPTFSEPSIPHPNLPPTRPHPLFPQNSTTEPPIIADKYTRANSFPTGT